VTTNGGEIATAAKVASITTSKEWGAAAATAASALEAPEKGASSYAEELLDDCSGWW